MTCLRCQGFLVQEPVGRRHIWYWRCINCGERVDRVILRHRAEQAMDRAWRGDAERRNLLEWAAWLNRGPAVSQSV
jgi:hypothetical protein